jgi:hypothetical protein
VSAVLEPAAARRAHCSTSAQQRRADALDACHLGGKRRRAAAAAAAPAARARAHVLVHALRVAGAAVGAPCQIVRVPLLAAAVTAVLVQQLDAAGTAAG